MSVVDRTVGICESSIGYEKMFLGAGWDVRPIKKVSDIGLHFDIILFTGGTDVAPSLYGEVRHPSTNNPDLARDTRERQFFKEAKRKGIPMVGICRGSQFLCVQNKGRLVQHVTNHGIYGTHKMITADGEEMDVTSTHHQMMQPRNNGKILAWAEGLSDKYEGSMGKIVKLDINGVEPEVVVWEKTKSLGFQYHPEYLTLDAKAVKYFFELVEDLIDDAA